MQGACGTYVTSLLNLLYLGLCLLTHLMALSCSMPLPQALLDLSKEALSLSQKNPQQHSQVSGVKTNMEAKREAAAAKEQAAQQEVTTRLDGGACIVLSST